MLSGAQTLDVISSRGMYERNPILGRGPFQTKRAVLIKAGLLSGVFGVEWLVKKRYKNVDKPISYINYSSSGVVGAVAVRNFLVK